VTGKSFLMLQKCLSKNPEKNLYCGFHKDMLQQKRFFDIFLSSKSSY